MEQGRLPIPDTVPNRTRKRSAALRYPGSKWSIADTIIAHFGEHYHYVEPFFGIGAVFFTKEPSPHELVNDLNGGVVNFFRALRDQTTELCWLLETTPWSRDEYELSDTGTGDPLEDARSSSFASGRPTPATWQKDRMEESGFKTAGAGNVDPMAASSVRVG